MNIDQNRKVSEIKNSDIVSKYVDESNFADILGRFRQMLTPELSAALSDLDCRRFIVARKGDLTKSVQMAEDWWIWWHQPLNFVPDISPSNILLVGTSIKYEKQELMNRFFPHCNHGEDKEGHPIYWEKMGAISQNISEAKKHFTLEELSFQHIQLVETIMCRLHHASLKHGLPILKHVIVFDMSNLSKMPDVYGFRSFHNFLKIDYSYYPERVFKIIAINAPWFFGFIFNIVKPMFDEATASKILILGENYLDTLQEYIDISQIPVDFGGANISVTWHRPWPEGSGCTDEDIANYLQFKGVKLPEPSSDTSTIIKNNEESPQIEVMKEGKVDVEDQALEEKYIQAMEAINSSTTDNIPNEIDDKLPEKSG